jgi:hypothetical protein
MESIIKSASWELPPARLRLSDKTTPEEKEMRESCYKKISKVILAAVLLITGTIPTLAAEPFRQQNQEETPMPADPAYIEAIQRTSHMTDDPLANSLVTAHGLNLVNVMWEDTGRYKNSSVGPNISDVTIQVMYTNSRSEGYQLALMPVIRYPNFSDITADLRMEDFYLLVGNEKGQPLQRVTLREYLGNFREYLHDPSSWAGKRTSLLAERDSVVLVSAQAAFLPVPQQGLAEFNPVIFNYQSYQGDPAILTIVATREGTSATIIDNVRDAFPAGFSWGQRLFFNQNGERASFTAERLSDFIAAQTVETPAPQAAGESGLNMVLVIQVPLKQKNPMRFYPMSEAVYEMAIPSAPTMNSDIEEAVIGHGKVEGPFTEIDGLDIERDENFPVRVTVQFYKATSNGIVTEADVQAISEQIQRVYKDAQYVGSLVVGGETGRQTEYTGDKVQPANWWQVFWQRFADNTGLTSDEAVSLWQKLKMTAGRWLPWLR